MRRLLILLTFVVLALSGCGGDGASDAELPDETSTTALTTTTTTTTTTTVQVEPSAAAIDVCDRVLQAEADGDAEAWRSVTASNATVLMPMDTQPRSVWAPAPWGGDDFDGDGVASIADGMMAEAALNPAVDASMEWACDPMADGRVDCSVTRVDEFQRRSGLEPGPYSRIYTVEGDQIAGWEIPPVLTEAEHNAAMELLVAQYLLYEQWVADKHADVFDDIFHGPCCDAPKVNTAESIAVHSELITEYFETTG